MSAPSLFKWRRFLPEVILLNVRWYCRHALSYRDLEEMMVEKGTLSQPLSPETKLQQLSEDDYGEMVAQVFERPADFLNREIEVASVDITMTEVAAAFSRVLGKPVEYQQIPFAAFEQQAGEEMAIMYRWFENVGYAADLAQLKRDFPEPTDFESYLRDSEAQRPRGDRD